LIVLSTAHRAFSGAYLRDTRVYIEYGRNVIHDREGKAIPLQAWTGPEGSRRLILLDFKTIGTWMW